TIFSYFYYFEVKLDTLSQCNIESIEFGTKIVYMPCSRIHNPHSNYPPSSPRRIDRIHSNRAAGSGSLGADQRPDQAGAAGGAALPPDASAARAPSHRQVGPHQVESESPSSCRLERAGGATA